MLVKGGADPNQIGTIQRVVPLHLSIIYKQTEISRYLLMHGARSDILTGDGAHPIHLAAQVGDIELVRLLAAKGVSLDLKDSNGKQLKHQAALYGQTEVLEMIFQSQKGSLEASFDIPLELPKKGNIQKESQVLEGVTPLHLAAISGNSEAVHWLLNHRANPEACTERGRDVLSFAAQSQAAYSMLELFTPFQVAHRLESIFPAIIETLRQDHLDGMILLYNRGISVNTALAEGNTGLHFACYFGALECTAWLLQNGANHLIINRLCQNALEISATNSSSEQFRLLLEYTQVDPNQRDDCGKTLLHLAVKENCFKHVMILIMHGASLDLCDSNRETPLHLAVKGRFLELTKLLLFCGANSNFQTVDGRLPIDLAAENLAEMREIFAELEVMQKTSKEGDSRLHQALRSRYLQAIILLAQIEEINQTNCKNETALDLAIQTNQIEAIMLLSCLGARCGKSKLEQ